MPRAVTRTISSSFATRSHARTSSENQSSAKAKSTSEMFPSPRPGKASSHHLKRSAPPTSSPLPRGNIFSSGPVTPPRATSSKRKRLNDAAQTGEAGPMSEELIAKFLKKYDIDVEERIKEAEQALQLSIKFAEAQMMNSILARNRDVMLMRMEDYLEKGAQPAQSALEGTKKRSSSQSIPLPRSHKTPRVARAGEIVYSARGSPILIAPPKPTTAAAVSSEDEEGENEPFFDTASDKSSSSESFSLPDEAAYTAQVIQEEKNRILSSEGFFPRSSSMYHRSSGT